tara:strand:+ start:940 stop:2094 length:1155 start_codon:yes stop_codon:yes gene_type:complete
MKKVPYTISDNSITIFWEGKPYTLRSDHANFKLAEKAILDARYDDLGDLLDISKAVENFVEGEIEVKDEIVYYKGHRLHGVVVDKLLDMLRSGMKDSAPLTNFITRLQANPSANSVNELYSFLSYKSLATTPEGRVLGYKGVQGDFWSSTGNADTIVVQGETNDRHQILNEVGATIEVARRCVDDNKDNHCSFGLHVGSYDYANQWAGRDGRLLLVEFDPQDAVSVPTDCDFQKLRVSKYKVISDITGTRKELDTPVYEANKPIYGSDENDYLDDEDDYLDEDDYDSDDLDERYDIDEDDSDDLDMDQTEKEEDVDLRVVVADYINKKIINNERVTINHINSLQVCRNHGTRCADILQLVRELSFGVEDNDDKTISALEVSYEF